MSPFLLLLLAQGAPEDLEFFEKKIRPVLVERCYECHSAESKKLKGNLYLDTREGVLKGGDLGPPLVPGDPEKSLLIRAIRYVDQDLKMPPKGRLSKEVVADFEAWVKRGAPDPRVKGVAAKGAIDVAAARKQWAFQAPRDPAPPAVKDAAWVKSPLDRFLLSRLEAASLKPAPPADKRTLIRRATYDLTGLPPRPEDVEAFLADESPETFARVIDRLLASPQYGERWGRHWLDVARYTDSGDSRGMFGLQDVGEAWRYRDWVVDAFNRDLPYDQFVVRQIAGDLLPGPFAAENIVATGLFAIGAWGNGDSDKEKQLTDIVDDQVDVIGRTFLGLTLACARCHDHKFDPIGTEDYYGLAGFFFSSHILPGPGPKTEGSQILRIPLAAPQEVEVRKKHEAAIAWLEKQVEKSANDAWAALGKSLMADTARHLRAVAEYRSLEPRPAAAEFATRKGLPPWAFSAWISYLGTGDLGLFTKFVKDAHGKPGLHGWQNAAGAGTPSATLNTTDQELAFGTIKMPARSVAIHPSPNAGVAAAWRSPITGTVLVSGRISDADAVCGDGIEWTLSRVSNGTVELSKGAIPNGGAQAIPEATLEVKEGDLLQIVILPKREYTCDTTAIEVRVSEPGGEKRVWSLTRDVLEGVASNPHPDRFGNSTVWLFYDMAKKPAAAALPPDSALAKWLTAADPGLAADLVQQALLDPAAAKGPDSKLYQALTDPKSAFWSGLRRDESILPKEAREPLAAQRQELARLKQTLAPPIPACHGLQEGGCPQTAYVGFHDAKVHIRGRYDRLGAVVPRRFPRLLADDAPRIEKGSGRLELARWIASPENPMTAKVMVNRIWQYHFGEGIVRTPNNYGKLGEPPTHPKLLEWLAREFVRSGWSMKAMHRQMMLSSAYRQSSIPDPATFKADPGNLLFGRMNRRRLSAEELRDSLLEAGAALDRTMTGPSVRELAGGRRTLYLTTVRSDRSTYRMLFDAADPGAIVDRRTDSTVAPQALFLLNHPFVAAQARALAQRAAKQGGADDAARIQWLHALLYGRPAADREVKIGMAALAQARDAEPAAGAGQTQEQIWEPYCHVLLCANEFIYVD